MGIRCWWARSRSTASGCSTHLARSFRSPDRVWHLHAVAFGADRAVVRGCVRGASPVDAVAGHRGRRAGGRSRAEHLRPVARLHVFPEHWRPAFRSRLARDPVVCRASEKRTPGGACSRSSFWRWWGRRRRGAARAACTAWALPARSPASTRPRSSLERGARFGRPSAASASAWRERLGVLLFIALTRMATGAWPHWGPYTDFIRLYTTGGLGALPMAPGRPGWPSVRLYAASAVTLIALVGCAQRSSESTVPASGPSPD